MKTLKQRLEQLMTEFGWEHADLVRVSGESSSVVSQWLGKGSKRHIQDGMELRVQLWRPQFLGILYWNVPIID